MVKQIKKSKEETKSITKDIMKTNQDIIEGLEKMKRKYILEKVRGKVMGYQKAIATLKSLNVPITSVN